MRLLAAATGLVLAAATPPDQISTVPGSVPGGRHFYPQHFERDGTYVPPHYGAPPKRPQRPGERGHLLPEPAPNPLSPP